MTAIDLDAPDQVVVLCRCTEPVSVPLADADEPATCAGCAARATRAGEPVHVGAVVVDVMQTIGGRR